MESGRGWLAGDWPSTGFIYVYGFVDGGDVLNITAAAWTARLPLVAFWRHNANAKC